MLEHWQFHVIQPNALEKNVVPISPSTGSLTTLFGFESKESQSLLWVHCPFPSSNIKQMSSLGLDDGFSGHY